MGASGELTIHLRGLIKSMKVLCFSCLVCIYGSIYVSITPGEN